MASVVTSLSLAESLLVSRNPYAVAVVAVPGGSKGGV